MSGFLPEQQVKNKSADEPWKKSETDRMLDLYFNGGTPVHIAQQLGRNPKAIKRRIEQFRCNERDWATRYEPRQRISRRGKRITENETIILQAHSERKVPIADTARLLARSVQELTLEGKVGVAEVKKLTCLAPTLDLIWAYRYIHFVYKEQVISDVAYDQLVQEEIEYGGGAPAFAKIKNHQGWPEHIKSLALYLFDRAKQEGTRCQECSVKVTAHGRKRSG